ncbi:MAG: hypothetical protein LWX11_09195 [Firmicutes bacterium]|nr:hypothetical protein [Bacillota bacterium]
MKMIRTLGSGLALAGLVGAVGCHKMAKDTSPVIANVGTEKITEKSFADIIHAMVPDEARSKEILTSEAMRSQRNEFLGQMAKTKALIQLGQSLGLDKDPAVKIRMEQAAAQAYLQMLMERRSSKLVPTEADYKAAYDELVAEEKAKNPGQAMAIPPYEQVKGQMPMIYKQRQEKRIFDQILQESAQKAPITYAEGHKPAN